MIHEIKDAINTTNVEGIGGTDDTVALYFTGQMVLIKPEDALYLYDLLDSVIDSFEYR